MDLEQFKQILSKSERTITDINELMKQTSVKYYKI
jgi:hypothetical protein